MLAITCVVVLAAEAPGVESRLPTDRGGSVRVPVQELIERGVAKYADGDLDAADAVWLRLRQEHPDHPAAPVWQLKTLRARRSLDFWSGEYDEVLRERADEAVELGRAAVERSPDSADANLYFGQALWEKTMLMGMDGHFYQAGKKGEESRKLLERALERNDAPLDLRYPLGTYYYFAGVATRYIGWLSWLWFVPTGERDTGLAYLQEVHARGGVFRYDAGIELAVIYMYMEDRPDLAEPIMRDLLMRHPRNSYLHLEFVELGMISGDYDGTIEAALALEQQTGGQFGDERRHRMARIWRARARLMQGQTHEAEEIIAPLEAQWDDLSGWSRRWIMLTRGNLHDVAGERKQALSLYEQIVDWKAKVGTRRTVELAKQWIDVPFSPPDVRTVPSISARP